MKKGLLFGLLLHIKVAICFAQIAENFPPPDEPVEIFATRATGKIIINGKLDESDWNSAPIVDDFFRMEPRQGGEVAFPTQVRILFDDVNLYVGAFCQDSLGKKGVRVQDLRRDFTYGENDVFYLQLDPQNLKRFNVSFQTTPHGNQRDLQVFDDILLDNDWDALWKVRTSILDSGYFVEMAIPFKSIRYDKPDGNPTSWGITLARLARRAYEQTVFPAIPQSFSPYRMTYAAELKGLELPPPSANIRVQPYGLVQIDQNTTGRGEQVNRTEWKAGGEVKWAISPSSVLDLTFNTDFAQVDVDRAVNNLTRFNVFFPERRQFFLENSGIFAGADNRSIRPFFSRAIGLSNNQFNAAPVPIEAGVRFTDRNQNRSLAGMYVRQAGTSFQAPVNFSVLRYLKNYGEQNNIGVMLSQRSDDSAEELGLQAQSNTTLTIDGLIRPSDDFTITYLASSTRQNSFDSLGFAGRIFAGYTPNNAYLGWLTNFVDNQYQPGMGFVFGKNIIQHNPGGYYIWRPAKGWLSKWVRRWDPGAFLDWFQTASTLKTQEVSIDIFPIYILTNSNGLIRYSIKPSWQNFDFSFPILGETITPGKYQNLRHEFQFRTDQSRKLSADLQTSFGDYFNGNLVNYSMSGRIAPIPQFALELGFEHNDISNLGENQATFSTELYTVGLRLAANPRILFSGFYQYNTFDGQGRINLRGSWEFTPLSFVYLVFNENQFQESPIQNQSVISKVTYVKQF